MSNLKLLKSNMALLDFLGGIFDSTVGAIGQAMSNNAQRKENALNREWSEKMWNKQNEYNLPINQMARLEAAGLNPNLVYGNGANTLAANVSSPNTDNSFRNPLANMGLFDAIVQSKQLKNQTKVADSQVKVNNAAVRKTDAEINEINSRIPTYEASVNYTNEMIENMKRQNKWYDLTEDVKYSLLEIDKLEKEGRIDLMAEQVLRLNAQTANDNKLTDMRLQLTANQISLMWKNYDNAVRELEGRLALWSKQGDAAKMQAVASLLNAATNSKQFDLNKQQFDKFSDAQLKLLQQNSVRLQSENAWIDILNEAKFANIESVTNLNNQRAGYQQNVNQNYDLDHAISIGSILINGLMPMLP